MLLKSYIVNNFNRDQEHEWNLYLNFIQQETNILKKRLRQIINHQIDSKGLTEAENLLARLIRLDEMLNRMRSYLFDFRRQFSDEPEVSKTEKRINQLKDGMGTLENNFKLLRNDFDLFAAQRAAA